VSRALTTVTYLALFLFGIAQGVVLPALIVERILPQLQVHLNVAPESSQFWHPIVNMPAEFPAADRKRLEDAAGCTFYALRNRSVDRDVNSEPAPRHQGVSS